MSNRFLNLQFLSTFNNAGKASYGFIIKFLHIRPLEIWSNSFISPLLMPTGWKQFIDAHLKSQPHFRLKMCCLQQWLLKLYFHIDLIIRKSILMQEKTAFFQKTHACFVLKFLWTQWDFFYRENVLNDAKKLIFLRFVFDMFFWVKIFLSSLQTFTFDSFKSFHLFEWFSGIAAF